MFKWGQAAPAEPVTGRKARGRRGPGDQQPFFYGGQAVLEGVMMRGRTSMAIAVRKGDGSIHVHERPLVPWTRRHPLLGKVFVRGIVALAEALVLGFEALSYSANQVAEEEGEKLGLGELVISMGLAVVLTVGLFIVLPAYAIRLLQASVPSNLALNLIEGAIKVAFFALYIFAISLLPDIRRVFQYHAAEHKAINCYEQWGELTPQGVAAASRVHTRCGTNFILVVLFMGVFLFSFFGRPPFVQRVLIHLALLPVVAGISYEVLRHAAQDRALRLIRLLARPGLGMQRLTTRPSDRDQEEVAIRALAAVLARDRATEVVPLQVGGGAPVRPGAVPPPS